MPNAYSYIRFSTPRQATGDSLRRQIEARDRWLVANRALNLALVDDYRDLGVSGWKGKNTATGCLKIFLDLVDEGKIERGSYLLVENLDRLSRADTAIALNLLTGLMLKGISVVTIDDGRIYSDAKEKDTMTGLMLALVYMSRASDESQVKSVRGLATWDRKRRDAASGKILTRMLPGWLSLVDEKIVPNEHADTVRRIFRLSADGHGSASILRDLNMASVPTINSERRKDGSKWSSAYIRLILENRAVLGELRPGRRGPEDRQVLTGDVVPNYFPEVIDPLLWDRAQAAVIARRQFASPPKPSGNGVRNLFSGLSKCLECGGFMSLTTSGKSQTPYLRCHGRYVAKTCQTGRMYNYARLEADILDRLEFAVMVSHRPGDALNEIEQTIGRLRMELARETGQRDRLTDRLAEAEGDISDLMPALEKRRERVRDAEARLKSAEEARQVEAAKLPAVEQIAVIRNLHSIMATGTPGEIIDARAKLASALQRVISQIGFLGDGTTVVSVFSGVVHHGFKASKWAWSRTDLGDEHWFNVAVDSVPSIPTKTISPRYRDMISDAIGRLNSTPAPRRQ